MDSVIYLLTNWGQINIFALLTRDWRTRINFNLRIFKMASPTWVTTQPRLYCTNILGYTPRKRKRWFRNVDNWILQSWSYYVKINFARHQHDTERTQTERCCGRRQLFRHSCSSSAVRRNKQKSSAENYTLTLIWALKLISNSQWKYRIAKPTLTQTFFGIFVCGPLLFMSIYFATTNPHEIALSLQTPPAPNTG